MIAIDNLMQVANQIETERGVSKEILFSAIEQSIVAACRKKFHEDAEVDAVLNPTTGEIIVTIKKEVVDEVEDSVMEISLADAKEIDPEAEIGSIISIIFENADFGRIAAQTAKQVIVQRIREAEKDAVFSEFQNKIGQIITGTVQRVENKNLLVNLGLTEAILSYRDQIPGEQFYAKDKIKVYLVDIERESRGNYIQISRTHTGLLDELFRIEIPEIQDGIIEIMAIAREAGLRSKVAVRSNNSTVGAVGTCVGQMGGRIQAIIKELNGEKIDVLEWDEDPSKFISNALKPAKVSRVIIENEEERIAKVIVPSDQLSLAIGKRGVNVRLSVRLTGWKLDIISDENEDRPEGSENMSLAEKISMTKQKESEESDETIEESGTKLTGLAHAIAQDKEDSVDDTVVEEKIDPEEIADA
jgi:transcription termination/antitermination protein NusA